MVLPLTIGRPASIAAAQKRRKAACKVGLLLQDDASIEQPGPEHLRRVGTVAEILRHVTSRTPIMPSAAGCAGSGSKNSFRFSLSRGAHQGDRHFLK
jgi:hypothetical protein